MTSAPTRNVVHDDSPPNPPMPPPPPAPGKAHTVALIPHLDDLQPVADELAAVGARVGHAADLRLWLLHHHGDVQRALDGDGWSNALTLAPIYQPCDAAMAIILRLVDDVPKTTAAGDTDQGEWMRGRAALEATFPTSADAVKARFGDIIRHRVGQVTELVAARHGAVDLVGDCANLLPLWTICDILGVPPSDIDRIKAWGDGQCALVWGLPDEAEQVRLAQGLLDFWRWCQDFVNERAERGQYGTDLTGRLLAWRAGNDRRISVKEVASLVFNLLVAGHETTAGLIAHSLEAALVGPGVWDRLVACPDSIGAHVTRTLRCAPPIDGWLRLASRDHVYGDVTVPAGARVLLMVGAANRAGGKPLSFGHGAHYCIGAALAHLETVALLRALVARVPGMRISPQWRAGNWPNVAFRRRTSLVATV